MFSNNRLSEAIMDEDLAIVVYRRSNGEGEEIWTARNDLDQASTPSHTAESKELAVYGLLQKLDDHRVDFEFAEVEDTETRVMLRRRDISSIGPMEGYFLKENADSRNPIDFGRIGDSALLTLEEAYDIKENYPKYDFKFEPEHKRV